MWKVVLKSGLGKASLFQASKLWNASQFRVAMGSPEFQKVSPVKVSPVYGMEFQNKNMVDKDGISKLEQRFSLPVEESGKGKKQSQITNRLDAKISLMEEFFKLEKELGRLEAMEADHSDHEYGRKMMELLARVETLYNEAKNYDFSAQSGWESFLVSVSRLEFEIQLKTKYSAKFSELNRLRQAYPKVSRIEGNLAEFWRSTSFPMEADIFRHRDLLVEWNGLTKELVPLLKSVIQEYPKDIEEVASVSPSPEKGKFFDVVELLSRFPGDLIRNDVNRSRVSLNRDTFEGKYVLICCFNVPVLPGVGSNFPFLINLCNELYSTRDEVEIVVVARMNSLANDEEVFHHLFSGFPKSCLAVPFKDSKRRDYICKVLGLGSYCYDFFECLLLNAEGIAFLTRGGIFSEYGADCFPFTEDILYKRELECKDMIYGKEGNWLERVLRCNDSSPDFVYKFNPTGGPREKMSISELSNRFKNKHVGVYLCTGGDISPDLLAMYRKCREVKLDFEVVLVNMPFSRMPDFVNLDPKVCQEKIHSLLKKHNICDWWCLPFNNSVSVRFFHLTYPYKNESVIVVGPDVSHLDIYGCNVMEYQGIEAFPFTVEAGVKGRANKIKEITLESLFVDGDASVFVRGNNSSDSKNLTQLIQGKKSILFFMDAGQCDLETLASIYKKTKEVKREDFELVFVVSPSLWEIPCHEMPWYICPVNALNSTKLEELMILVCQPRDVLVAFGGDGCVCSCQTTRQVTDLTGQFSLGDTLYCDVRNRLGYNGFYSDTWYWD